MPARAPSLRNAMSPLVESTAMPESLISATPSPNPGAEVQVEEVLAIVRRHLPSYWQDRPLSADLRLDDAGIGFDSVDLLELLVACERELGREMPPDLLLDDAMTLGDLIAKLQGAAPAP
jgi:acyl carrier protein